MTPSLYFGFGVSDFSDGVPKSEIRNRLPPQYFVHFYTRI